MSREKNSRKKVDQIEADVRSRKDAYDWIQCLITALIICVINNISTCITCFFIYYTNELR